MKPLVRFAELEPPGAPGTRSLAASVGALDEPTAERVADYLERGIPVIDIMEAVEDPLDPATLLPGGSSLLTDGTWFWRHDLAHFVRKYRAYVPSEFVDFIRDREPPADPDESAMRRLIQRVERAREEASR